MSKSIRVDEETHAMLAALKQEDETYDDLLSRLLAERQKIVAEGAGLWAGSDAADAARAARNRSKESIGQ